MWRNAMALDVALRLSVSMPGSVIAIPEIRFGGACKGERRSALTDAHAAGNRKTGYSALVAPTIIGFTT